ncbi:AAA domain family protein, partial [Vibrio parahaemolyticus V-223/04]
TSALMSKAIWITT